MVAVILGGLFGFSAVLLGSVGAHALTARVGEGRARTWDRAVRYQMLHGVLLVALGALLATHALGQFALVAAWILTAGIVVFCGSLYVLAGTGKDRLSVLAPVGGVLLMAGWLAVAVSAVVR